jgi:hypothetical protein
MRINQERLCHGILRVITPLERVCWTLVSLKEHVALEDYLFKYHTNHREIMSTSENHINETLEAPRLDAQSLDNCACISNHGDGFDNVPNGGEHLRYRPLGISILLHLRSKKTYRNQARYGPCPLGRRCDSMQGD